MVCAACNICSVNKQLIVLFALMIAVGAQGAPRRRAASPPVPGTDPGCVPLTYVTNTYSSDVEVDDQYVYYCDDFGGVFRVPKIGGGPQMLAQLSSDHIVGLMAIDETNLYILSITDAGNIGDLHSLPKNGGELTTYAKSIVVTVVATIGLLAVAARSGDHREL